MNERELIEAGLIPHGSGTLHTPARVTLAPAGADFFHVMLELPNNAVLCFHIGRRALKIQNEEEKQK